VKISKVLSVGDFVYSSANGKPMKVTKVCDCGFYTEDDFYGYEEHRSLYYLTKVGYEDSKKRSDNNG
jgi:hypothetical protein